jgi:hypothetical protein
MMNHVFVTLMDTFWNSASVAYRWESVSCFAIGVVILEQVMDLVSYTKEVGSWLGGILFGYEVAY